MFGRRSTLRLAVGIGGASARALLKRRFGILSRACEITIAVAETSVFEVNCLGGEISFAIMSALARNGKSFQSIASHGIVAFVVVSDASLIDMNSFIELIRPYIPQEVELI